MKHLLSAWAELEKVLYGRHVMLFLDYDGTLTEIVVHPSLALLSPQRLEILRALSTLPGLTVSVLSGRPCGEVEKLVGIPDLIYAGNHGLEWKEHGMRHVHPPAVLTRMVLRQVTGQLTKAFSGLSGVFVENKGLTVSVHYRLANTDVMRRAKAILSSVLAPYRSKRKIRLTEGKKVWEIRPPTSWDKGSIVMHLIKERCCDAWEGILPICLGDDVTDEDAFRRIRGKGIGVKITQAPERPSAARYYLRSPQEVFVFLTRLARFCRDQISGSSPGAECA